MVYVDPKNLGYKPYWQKWVSTRPTKKEQDDMNLLYEKYIPNCIDLVIEGIQDGRQGEKVPSFVDILTVHLHRFSHRYQSFNGWVEAQESSS